MELYKFLPLLLVLLAACEAGPSNEFLSNPTFCNVDADCTCGGIDTNTNDCFIGNKLYSSKYVDLSIPCPDFCSGIDGRLVTRCIDNACQGVREPIACTDDGKVCPDGTMVGRTGPNCEFAPCPGGECTTAADCVPASCCHATSCVTKSRAPACEGMMCTLECQFGTLDCGGSCGCVQGKCIAKPVAPGEDENEKSCEEKGGNWERRFVGYICNFPASDAGKTCTDSSQCVGMCLTDDASQTEGTCSEMQVVYGCINPLENGKVTPMCID